MMWLWISLAIFLGIVIGISVAIAGAKNLLDDILNPNDHAARRISKQYERDRHKGLHKDW